MSAKVQNETHKNVIYPNILHMPAHPNSTIDKTISLLFNAAPRLITIHNTCQDKQSRLSYTLVYH